MRRQSVCVTAAIAALGLPSACGAQSSGSGSGPKVPPKDSFKGQLNSGTASMSGAHGKVGVKLVKTGSTSNMGSSGITLAFRGLGCSHKQKCVQPSGTLKGTMTSVRPPVPDVGTGFNVKAAGKLQSLGHVNATGTIHGTGFIANGYITMVLKLSTKNGTVTVDAKAGPVKGFTSP